MQKFGGSAPALYRTRPEPPLLQFTVVSASGSRDTSAASPALEATHSAVPMPFALIAAAAMVSCVLGPPSRCTASGCSTLQVLTVLCRPYLPSEHVADTAAQLRAEASNIMADRGQGADLADSLMRRLDALRDLKPASRPKTADELAARANALFYGNAGSSATSFGSHGADSLEARLAPLAGETHPAKQAIVAARASLRPGAGDYEARLMLLQLAESMEASGDHSAALSALRAGEFTIPASAPTTSTSCATGPHRCSASGRSRVDPATVERLAAEGAAAAAMDVAAFGKIGAAAQLPEAAAPRQAIGGTRTERPHRVGHSLTPSGASSDDESDCSSGSSTGSSSSGGGGGSSSARRAQRHRKRTASSAKDVCAAASRLLDDARRDGLV